MFVDRPRIACLSPWLAAAIALALSVASHGAAPPDGPGVLPGMRPVDMVRLQARIVHGARPEQALTPAQLRIARRYGSLPDGAERYAHALLLALPDLATARRAALAAMVRDVEASPSSAALHKRFWRLAYLLLTPRQAAALTPHLPFKLRHGPNPVNDFTLPGLTASQANRIRARFTELEAVMAPIQARAREAEARHDRDAMLAAQEVMTARLAEVEDAVAAVLTPRQRTALLELPPFTDGPELPAVLPDLMAHASLTPDQARQVQPLVAALPALQAETEARAKRLMRQAAADDREGMGMMAAMRGIQAPLEARALDVARRLAAVLTDAQRIAWMHAVTPTADPARPGGAASP